MPTKLTWQGLSRPGQWFLLGRYRMERLPVHPAAHSHDFAELFWVESGSGVQVVNGDHQALTTHDLVFVRPGDEHAFGTVRKGDFTIINLAYPTDCLEFLLGRYALAGTGAADWWQAPGAPRVWHLSPAESHRVAAAFAQLAEMPQARVTVEQFLLNVICDTKAIRQGDPLANSPDWLRKALRELHAAPAAVLQEGPAGLARLCGRTLAHVSRVLMAGTGLTPTQVVNQVRLQRAATLLSTTDTPADRVSLECGYQSVSHFFRLFRQHHGQTPRQYRNGMGAYVRNMNGFSILKPKKCIKTALQPKNRP